MKYKIKAKDILPYMETKLISLIENPDKIYTVTWNKYAPSVICVEGFYAHFIVDNGLSKEELLKTIEVR